MVIGVDLGWTVREETQTKTRYPMSLVASDFSNSEDDTIKRDQNVVSSFQVQDKLEKERPFAWLSKDNITELVVSAKDQILHPTQKEDSQYRNPVLRYVDDFFRITTRKSSISTEVIGGVTSFFTTAYILTIHPLILSFAGMPQQEVFVATAILAGLGSITLGVVGGFPIIMAPAMGMNAFFVSKICGLKHYTYHSALGITLLAGILQLLLVVCYSLSFVILQTFGFTRRLVTAIPEYYRIGLAVGLALFLALIGAENMHLVVADASTLITLGAFKWRIGIGLLGLIIMGGLILREWKSAFLVSMLFICVLSIIIRAIFEREDLKLDEFGNLAMKTIAGSLNFDFDVRALYIIPLITIHHLFDAVATALVLLRQAYFSDTKVQLRSEDIEKSLASSAKVRYVLIIDALFVILSALLGSSLTTPFIESATGISVGAKTGLASVVAGLLFLLSIFIGPIIEYIVPEATGPALIVTAMILMPQLRHLNWDKMEEVLPAMLTLIMIPFSYSIADGSAMGYCFILTWVLAGKVKQISIPMWVLIGASLFQLLASKFGFDQ